MPPSIHDILTNREVIAVDQDPLGKQGRRVWGFGDQEIWTRALADGSTAVGVFNRGVADATVTVPWSEIGLATHGAIRDLWSKASIVVKGPELSATVPAHGVAFWRVAR
jgi:alpha-galactosidase